MREVKKNKRKGVEDIDLPIVQSSLLFANVRIVRPEMHLDIQSKGGRNEKPFPKSQAERGEHRTNWKKEGKKWAESVTCDRH